MSPRWDLILVGGGLANGLIAWRLHHARPDLRLLMVEAGAQPGGNHTWSFHQADLTEAQHRWIAPLVSHRWPGYEVRFPARQRTLEGGYLSISSEHFAQKITQTLGAALLTDTPVASLTPQSVILESGETLHAGAVIDGRGYLPDAHLTPGFQSFLGQHWQLAEPHQLQQPILMDATVSPSIQPLAATSFSGGRSSVRMPYLAGEYAAAPKPTMA